MEILLFFLFFILFFHGKAFLFFNIAVCTSQSPIPIYLFTLSSATISLLSKSESVEDSSLIATETEFKLM